MMNMTTKAARRAPRPASDRRFDDQRTICWDLALDAIGASSAFRVVLAPSGVMVAGVKEGEIGDLLTVQRLRGNDEVRDMLTMPGEPWARTTAVVLARQADAILADMRRLSRRRSTNPATMAALGIALAQCAADLAACAKEPEIDLAAGFLAEAARRDAAAAQRDAEAARQAAEAVTAKLADAEKATARTTEARKEGGRMTAANALREREALRTALTDMLRARAVQQRRTPDKVKLPYDDAIRDEACRRMTGAGMPPRKRRTSQRNTYPSRHVFEKELTKARADLKKSAKVSPSA